MSFDTIKGMLFGVALGDALGAPFGKYETEFSLSQYNGKLTNKNGKITDNAGMTFALARYLIKTKCYEWGGSYIYNKETVVLSYEEFAKNCTGIEENAKALFKGIKTFGGYQKRSIKMFGEAEGLLFPSSSQSNGALMRCSPLVCLFKESPFFARIDTSLTNPNKVCIAATELYLLVLRAVIEGKNTKKISVYIKRWRKNNKDNNNIVQVIDDLFSSGENSRKVDGKDKGWAPHALYVALYCLLNTDTFNKGIDCAILFGGDTNVNGAITGALLGAKYGYSSISTSKRQLNNISTIKQLNDSLGDIDNIAKQLANMLK